MAPVALTTTASFGDRLGGGLNDLALPNGSTVGQTSNEVLRQQFARLNIEGAHVDGIQTLIARYAQMLDRIRTDAGNIAVNEFFARHRS